VNPALVTSMAALLGPVANHPSHIWAPTGVTYEGIPADHPNPPPPEERCTTCGAFKSDGTWMGAGSHLSCDEWIAARRAREEQERAWEALPWNEGPDAYGHDWKSDDPLDQYAPRKAQICSRCGSFRALGPGPDLYVRGTRLTVPIETPCDEVIILSVEES